MKNKERSSAATTGAGRRQLRRLVLPVKAPNPFVAGRVELHRPGPELSIRRNVAGYSRGFEVVERHEEAHAVTGVDDVLQEVELDVRGEVFKQGKEVAVSS